MKIENEVHVLEFSIGDDDTVYSLPLMNHLPLRMAQRFSKMALIHDEDEKTAAGVDMMIALFEKYAPDLAESVTIAEAEQVFEAWNKASQEDGGIELGES